MQIRFTDAMLKAIAKHVHEVHTERGILDVYRAAEIIRVENISDNMAREDIIEKLVKLAGAACVPLEFNKVAFESEGAFHDPAVFITNSSFMETLGEESVH